MTTALPPLRTLQIRYTLIQMLYWSAYAALGGFQTALLLERGFSSGEVGVFAALRCLAGILVPAIGGWADRHPRIPLKYILCACLTAAMGITLLFYFVHPGFLGTAVILFLLGIVELNIYPLLNSLAVQFINVGLEVNYSLSRGLGSLAYAILCVVLGRVSASVGVEWVLPINMVFLAGLIVAALLFPTAPVPENSWKGTQEKPHSAGYILKQNPPFALMLAAVFLGMSAMMPIQSFMYNIVESLGGNESHLGLALFLMGAAELPSAFVFPHLWRRLGSRGMMVMALLLMLLKSIGMMVPVLGVVLGAQLLQTFGYGLFLPTSLYYVNENVPVVDQVRGQAIMMLASTGLGGVAGNLVSGFLIDLGGVRLLMIYCVAVGVLGVLAACAALRWTKKRSAS